MRPGKLDPEQERCAREGLDAALAAGSEILRRGETAVDAVEAASPEQTERAFVDFHRRDIQGVLAPPMPFSFATVSGLRSLSSSRTCP